MGQLVTMFFLKFFSRNSFNHPMGHCVSITYLSDTCECIKEELHGKGYQNQS